MTDKQPYHECQNDPQVILLICGPEDYRKPPEVSDTRPLIASLLKLLRTCWSFEAEKRPISTMCLNQVQLIYLGIHCLLRVGSTKSIFPSWVATPKTNSQSIPQSTIALPATTTLRISAPCEPAAQVPSALAKTPPTQPTSSPARASRAPRAKALPEIYVQLVKSHRPKTPEPTQGGHTSPSPDPHTKPLREAPAPRRQSGHAQHASHPVEEQIQEVYDGLPSYDSGSHPSRRPSSQNSRRASLSRGNVQRRQTTPPTLDYERDYGIAMRDFSAEPENAAGEVIRVFNRSPTGWWDGELDGLRGWLPNNYTSGEVTASVAARELASYTTVTVPDVSQEKQAALSRDQAPSRSGSRASSSRPWVSRIMCVPTMFVSAE